MNLSHPMIPVVTFLKFSISSPEVSEYFWLFLALSRTFISSHKLKTTAMKKIQWHLLKGSTLGGTGPRSTCGSNRHKHHCNKTFCKPQQQHWSSCQSSSKQQQQQYFQEQQYWPPWWKCCPQLQRGKPRSCLAQQQLGKRIQRAYQLTWSQDPSRPDDPTEQWEWEPNHLGKPNHQGQLWQGGHWQFVQDESEQICWAESLWYWGSNTARLI